ncbi:efflux RND transporter periplasmic adaptor subunit [Flavihumibacter solisilvae]|uniref:Copper transporter n=1 Tax=Flavihumibacter solisilvae TaxID=1349421 RepID=A0A0C1L265_9BACT|nr:efflux RND transporter periplasmic adaptor subunit [Flavihumibacter solisilvae]KIC93691.1 copper transporter [Flavihumibacter solisilvae]
MKTALIALTIFVTALSCKDSNDEHAGHVEQVTVSDSGLDALVRPTDEFVLSGIAVTTMQKHEEQIEIEALGSIAYDTKETGSIAARASGRIERLYVRYRYQKIRKGQHIMDIYSPEVLTAQQNLLFLLKNDPANNSLVEAAKERLILLGMSSQQLQQVIRSGKASPVVAVYSGYGGHIHEAANGTMEDEAGKMKDISLLTAELSVKEGMYLQKGQSVFSIFNPDRAWVLLNIYGESQSLVRTGNTVRIVPETVPGKDFRAKIDFIEPFYRKENKTLTARVHFDNSELRIPIGSQVRATVFGNTRDASWLPKEAVLSLGLKQVVFRRVGDGFRAQAISTGISNKQYVQVLEGLDETDSVAINAQYLMDSESFIKIKQ